MENEKKKSIILMLVAIIALLTLIVGATYAYFKAIGNSGSDTDVNVVTATSDLLTFKIDKDINKFEMEIWGNLRKYPWCHAFISS